MLPLLQMPPHAVTPTPSHLDPFADPLSHELSSTHQYYSRNTSIPLQQSFPIRTSQPQRQSTAASNLLYHTHPDHHLRRKTPNGTIDAGYDGSPVQLSQGPPPLKHMILPGPVRSASYPSTSLPSHHLHSPVAGNPHIAHPETMPLNETGSVQFWSTLWPPLNSLLLQSGPYQEQPWNSQHLGPPRQYQPNVYVDGTGTISNVYPPLVRTNEYNVRAFCPPPTVVNDALPLGQITLQNVPPSPWESGSPEQLRALSLAYSQRQDISSPQIHVSPESIRRPFPASRVTSDLLSSSVRSPTSGRTTSFNPNTNAQGHVRPLGFDGQAGFREKVLVHAHKSYMDLISYVQNVRRSHSGKLNPTLALSPKLLVYPKPPRITRSSMYIDDRLDRIRGKRLDEGDICPATGLHKPSRIQLPYATDKFGIDPTRFTSGGMYSQVNQAQSRRHGLDKHLSLPGFLEAPERPSPPAAAKSSLELITSLCEQSEWKWVDGMLLGGCLHYGLEHYEEALEWFSRITTLDSSHAEAITNMAATLYCLNRQDEAEKQWLRAVKLRPSYLEAAEHLVGLLYKKRSMEAIEIINFIQQALRLSPQDSAQSSSTITSLQTFNEGVAGPYRSFDTLSTDVEQKHDDAITYRTRGTAGHGFGSSGYAVPGRENGRILALIHAKGTMLYSLKEIDKASEAFEEAVLISTGRRMTGIQDLVHQIHSVLAPTKSYIVADRQASHPLHPLLLPPERARHTAHLVFGGSGELPGLRYMVESPSKRTAVQTTSNSLLSLAKIFQDAMSSGSACSDLPRRPSGVGDILALYYLSLSLQESPSTANNVGILLASVQQVTPRSENLRGHTLAYPNIPGIVPGSGLALALAYYHYGLRLDPKHVHLHTNLGSLLKDIGQLDLAIQMYEQAVSCDGTFDIALTNLANAVKDRGRINDAIVYYKRAVNSNPDFSEAVCGLFTALNSVCDWRGRGGVMLQSGKYDRWHVNEQGLLVDAKVRKQEEGLAKRVVDIVTRQLDEASRWGCGVLNRPTIAALVENLHHLCTDASFDLEGELRQWAGAQWEGSRLIRLVERATRVIQRKWYFDRLCTGGVISSEYRRPRLHLHLAVPSAPTVLPFHTFTCPLAARDIRLISQRNAIRISCSTLRLPWVTDTVFPPPPPPNPQINVGYVSSDFNNHPLAHLMQSVFGLHDPRRVRACCYATTASDKSIHRQQIEREAPVFRDVSAWSSEKLVEQIITDEIHILVNLNGYTRGARNEVFAARPAPIQMSFMGFAGTLGAGWCDYVLADSTAVPPETLRPWRSNVDVEDVFRDETEGEGAEWVYSENVIFCRDTFFCCDHAQSSDRDERNVTWEGEQRRRWKMRKELFPSLSDDVIILGNFNQLYKIEPTTFRSWLRILAQVPKAVLWLLRFPELGEANLRRTAKDWAGAEVASRLVFTDVAPKSQHISRARVCDLFLDTPECNAHTTAADVLWSSTPLLTLPRYSYKMCSRMAASILKGALPKSREGQQVASELIAENDTQYEQMAVRLAGGLSYNMKSEGYGIGCGRLADMRKLLWDNKWKCGLFDTRRWVSDVETAYEEAWRRWVAGESGDIYL